MWAAGQPGGLSGIICLQSIDKKLELQGLNIKYIMQLSGTHKSMQWSGFDKPLDKTLKWKESRWCGEMEP